MPRKGSVFFYSGVVLWGLFAAALVIYLFFPYEKALKIALQNMVGGSRMSISMEGVSLKSMGIKASRVLLRQDGTAARSPVLELSKIDVSWNPLSLVRGKLTVYSRASAYDGSFRCTIDGIPMSGPFNPNLSFTLENVNIGKYPQGTSPFVKGISGILNGWLKKEVSQAKQDKQTGSFRFSLKNGEIRELQVKNMPRLIIPYKEIAVEGRLDGNRIEIKRFALDSDLVSVKGSGSIDTGDLEPNLDIKLAYEALSASAPLRGKGSITVNGTQSAPAITISETREEGKQAQAGQK